MKADTPPSASVPLSTRLERINKFAVGTAVATIAVIIVGMTFAVRLMNMVQSSQLQAKVLAENASAALIFQDTKAAGELLQSVHNLPEIEAAALYTTQGQIFARFQRKTGSAPETLPLGLPEDFALGPTRIVVTQPVIFEQQERGIVQLHVGLGGLYRQTAWQILGALAAAFVAMIPSQFLLRRLNGSVLSPIFRLTALMNRVSEHSDYSARTEHSDINELNALGSGFNDMLGQIQERDRSLGDEVARNSAILSAVPDLLFELDMNGRYISYHSPRSDVRFAPPEVFLGKTVAEVLPPAQAQICMSEIQAALESGVSTGKQIELQLSRGVFWFELSVSRMTAVSGQEPHFIFLARDITERRKAEEQIRRLAYVDSLTELPNRRSFLERIDREIGRAHRNGTKLSVLFMDLDGFKSINDTVGHDVGDRCLTLTADRLREGLRPCDIVARPANSDLEIELARLGGDEFTALVLGISRPEDAWAVANRLRELMRRPLHVDGREILLTASIGIALYPDDANDAATLLKHADTAMYHAKSEGRDNCQFYMPALTERAMRRMNLATDLRQALDRSEFRLVYQPQFDPVQGCIASVEALIRWDHPERGLISPLDFIPLAEESGLIVPIGEWVLRTACAQGATWILAGSPLRVAVNLSAAQFKSSNLLAAVRNALEITGLPPSFLELEITESAVMHDEGQTLAILFALRDMGVCIALDDFGTGYSSMSYLKRMPLDNLKVDRSFVSGLPRNTEDHAIVRAILSMAKSLGFSVTAEGVETVEQARTLIDLACDTLQGYYFSKPVPAIEIPALLTRKWQINAHALNLVGSNG